MLLSNVFTEHGIEVHVATDDADTMVASKALNLSFNEDVEVKAQWNCDDDQKRLTLDQ